MRVRGTCLLLAATLVSGCASGGQQGGSSGSGRTIARNILIGLAVGTAAVAVGSAFAARSAENSLRDDAEAGTITGREFADRDATGLRWNRITRASFFLSGLSIIGTGVVWEMGEGVRVQTGERTPADNKTPIFPVRLP